MLLVVFYFLFTAWKCQYTLPNGDDWWAYLQNLAGTWTGQRLLCLAAPGTDLSRRFGWFIFTVVQYFRTDKKRTKKIIIIIIIIIIITTRRIICICGIATALGWFATPRWHICYARQKCDLFSADLLQARADLLQARQICCGSGRIVADTQMTCASVLSGPTKWLGGSEISIVGS